MRLNVNNNLNTCPASNISYIGSCPVKTCPANLCRLTRNTKQGCYFNLSTDTSLQGIAEALSITMRQASNDYNLGIKELERIILPLVELKHNNDACDECGELKCGGGEKCWDRKLVVERALNKYPFTIKEFQVTPYMIWLLAASQENNGEYNLLDKKTIDFYKENKSKKGKAIL